ncbi:peptide ABC transporter [Salinisphaera orenii MK-B5]|uniref:Peptide ABC transporter n=1 Tax=Salinisphaera orenii MK-B5 TaxID=856730 RepID=A0A423PFY1_9GAMM|nr:ABC transporter ATP-binding protein [Salinisphaera orenii]ROO24541.1 peptide ABC transporter [Salinisphaera orenii MK-B5]
MLDVQGLSKLYPVSDGESAPMRALRGWARHQPCPAPKLHAVDDVNFTIGAGESVGLVGESGCGKSTLVSLITRLIEPSAGAILFEGEDIAAINTRAFARSPERGAIQVVFQDPHDSLNPRHSAFDAIAEPLRRLKKMATADCRPRVAELARDVGLPEELLDRLPHQLSGGQKARVNIARALAPEPRLLVLDEPTSALDVSVQAVILKLLADLRSRLGISYLFVSHDLNVVRLLCDRVIVMYLGRIVETGTAEQVFEQAAHPYTRALISAIPRTIEESEVERIHLPGDPRSPVNPDPNVCRFYGRCPRGVDQCQRNEPRLQRLAEGHEAACHFADEASPLSALRFQ